MLFIYMTIIIVLIISTVIAVFIHCVIQEYKRQQVLCQLVKVLTAMKETTSAVMNANQEVTSAMKERSYNN